MKASPSSMALLMIFTSCNSPRRDSIGSATSCSTSVGLAPGKMAVMPKPGNFGAGSSCFGMFSSELAPSATSIRKMTMVNW